MRFEVQTNKLRNFRKILWSGVKSSLNFAFPVSVLSATNKTTCRIALNTIVGLHFFLSYRRNQDGLIPIPSTAHLLNELGFIWGWG